MQERGVCSGGFGSRGLNRIVANPTQRIHTSNTKKLILPLIISLQIELHGSVHGMFTNVLEHILQEGLLAPALTIWNPEEDRLCHHSLVPDRDMHLLPTAHGPCSHIVLISSCVTTYREGETNLNQTTESTALTQNHIQVKPRKRTRHNSKAMMLISNGYHEADTSVCSPRNYPFLSEKKSLC